MTDSDLLSITEAAKRLGLHRPKLSTIVAKHGIPKKKKGNEYLISFAAVQAAVQTEAATGGIRSPSGTKTKRTDEDAVQRLLEDQIRELKEANRELKTENTQLRDRVESLVHVETELKLLKAGLDEPKRKGATTSPRQAVRDGAKKLIDKFLGD